jgi:hypothetical protein
MMASIDFCVEMFCNTPLGFEPAANRIHTEEDTRYLRGSIPEGYDSGPCWSALQNLALRVNRPISIQF